MSRGALKKVFPIYQLIDLIFEMDNISSSEKLLCIALLRFHNRKSGRCFPGLTRLSESTGMSRKTLIENTKKLEKKKVIKVKKGNRTKPNEYTLLFIGWLDIEPQSEPQSEPHIEPLSEPPIEPQPEPLTTPKQRKGKVKERDNKINISPEIIDFTEQFSDYVCKLNPNLKKPDLKKSADTVDKLIRLDGFTLDYIIEAIRWAVKDDFWGGQVFSLAPLRAKSKNTLTKFQNISNSFNNRNRVNGKKRDRSEQNAQACLDFINDED